MTWFDTFAMVDWSGGNDKGPSPKADAIWAAVARSGAVENPVYLRNRQVAETWLLDLIDAELSAGRRLCLGFDFPFGYPMGFAEAVVGNPDPLKLWRWFAEQIEDTPKLNNRFDVAGALNRKLGDGRGPFWANGLKRDIPGLPRTRDGYANPFPERRDVENLAKGSFTCWQMAGAGAVGSQVMMGLPVLHMLRERFAGRVAVWPFEPLDKPVALIEIWPSLSVGAVPEGWIKDAWQVHEVARMLVSMPAVTLKRQLDIEAPEEGWILGVPAPLSPPPLRNDCFALPAGVDWTPVDQALELLATRLKPVTGIENLPVRQALGRVLAEDAVARRANPPRPNTAVDGFGFAGGVGE
ncbi:MAG: molybdopterin molybdenumtransferase MoeA, partial [Arenibacterium sp.]